MLTQVDVAQFSIGGYTRGYQRAAIQGLIEAPVSATPIGAAWEIGVSGGQALTGQSSGLHISSISSVLVDDHWDVGRELSGGHRALEGVLFAVGALTLGLGVRAARVPRPAVRPSEPLLAIEQAELDSILGGNFVVPPTEYYGPFVHAINKGGLDDIVATQQLMATRARNVAGGGEAVRAHAGGIQPAKGAQVEFYTTSVPAPHPAGYMRWFIDSGDYLSIFITRTMGSSGNARTLAPPPTRVLPTPTIR